MLTIGLTGGIGSGKSSVTKILVQLGAVAINADTIGHEVYRAGAPGWSKVVEAFGRGIVASNGEINRKALGQLVFSAPAELERLNAIVHPLIAAEIQSRIARYRATGVRSPIVIEAAILLEARWERFVDEVWIVVATRDLAIERVTRDRGLNPAEVERRLASQLSDQDRIAAAHCVIQNTGSIEDLRTAVERAWRDRVVRN